MKSKSKIFILLVFAFWKHRNKAGCKSQSFCLHAKNLTQQIILIFSKFKRYQYNTWNICISWLGRVISRAWICHICGQVVMVIDSNHLPLTTVGSICTNILECFHVSKLSRQLTEHGCFYSGAWFCPKYCTMWHGHLRSSSISKAILMTGKCITIQVIFRCSYNCWGGGHIVTTGNMLLFLPIIQNLRGKTSKHSAIWFILVRKQKNHWKYV
jgi:hypothetical protein